MTPNKADIDNFNNMVEGLTLMPELTNATNNATQTLMRVSKEAAEGFAKRRNELEAEIEIRQDELADVNVAIEGVNATIKSIEAGLSIKKVDQKPSTLLGASRPGSVGSTVKA